MAEPVDDMLFADIAPHYAERAHADLVERAEGAPILWSQQDAIREILDQLPRFSDPSRDKRKHGDDCWKRHVDCLADKISREIWE